LLPDPGDHSRDKYFRKHLFLSAQLNRGKRKAERIVGAWFSLFARWSFLIALEAEYGHLPDLLRAYEPLYGRYPSTPGLYASGGI
jgi:hypothetical protein